jgi:hypothetical protein
MDDLVVNALAALTQQRGKAESADDYSRYLDPFGPPQGLSQWRAESCGHEWLSEASLRELTGRDQPVQGKQAFTRKSPIANSPDRNRDMHYNARVFAAVIGGSAVVTLGALGTRVIEGQAAPASTFESSHMTLGSTSTATVAPNAPTEGEAAPAIRGPAQLPTEEQDLTGIEGRHR